MKAILLAGGEGSRLRPISAECPKPMVRLLDKPLLEWSIALLAKHGCTDITATLQTLPHKVTDYFGDGSSLGVRMRYQIENTPLGTAGGVRACRSFIEDEPVVVLSGDAVTDMDLSQALRFHLEKQADATLVLHRQEKVLEYGLVLTDPEGRILQFIEKPSAGQVFTDMVNTGIYILSPHVLDMIPENTFYDFAKDLFPRMLADNRPIYGYAADGYWCDVGDAMAYLNCCFDVLDGQLSTIPAPQIPVYSPEIRVIPPCYIAEGVHLGRGCRIGPYGIVGAGSRIGDGAVVECSVIDGAVLAPMAHSFGAFIGRGTVLREGAVLREGTVVGEDVLIGARAEISNYAKIWPHKEIPPDARVSGSIVTGSQKRVAVFNGRGTLTGQPHVELTPDFCLRLGSAVAGLSQGETAVSWQGGDAARVAAMSLETGLCAAGGRVVLTDARFGQCASFGAELYRFPFTLFLRQKGDMLSLYIFDEDGLPISRETERKLEALTARGEVSLADADGVGRSRPLGGLMNVYDRTAATPPEWFVPNGICAARVPGAGTASSSLRQALEISGCAQRGDVNGFFIDEEGESFSARDETGRHLPCGQLLAMLMWLEKKTGGEALALAYEMPAGLDEWAETLGLRLLRLGRDGNEARELFKQQRFMRDAVFACTRLCYGLRTFGLTLKQLSRMTPALYQSSVEVELEHEQGAIMKALAAERPQAELVDGLRTRVDYGWVHVSPLPGRRALRIVAEGASEEIADEICLKFQKTTKNKDRQSEISMIQC